MRGLVSRRTSKPLFRKTVLPNGVRVLTEKHPLNRAVSCGLWVEKGTRDELTHEAGLAHFTEHMVFKRTQRRSAYEIARSLEAVGGDLNAFTSREHTCFVTHTLSENLALSLDVLSDIVCRPSFLSSDIKKEKQVVIQEILMAEDQLEDAIFDHYLKQAFAGSSLGMPILGSVQSIRDMPRKTLVDFHRRLYRSDNLIVSVAGNVDHDRVVESVQKYLKWPSGDRIPKKKSASAGRAIKNDNKNHQDLDEPTLCQPDVRGFRQVIRRPSEQAHILVGMPASDFTDRLRFAGLIVNSLLGGGMTSRLYQKIREEKGLVYSVHSQLMTFMDSGLDLTYAGTEPKSVPEVIELILREMRRLRKTGMKRSELNLFKTQVKGQVLLGADDVENRMNSLGVNEMVLKKYRSVDEVINEIDGVDYDAVHEYIERYFDRSRTGILVMGPMPEDATLKWLQQIG